MYRVAPGMEQQLVAYGTAKNSPNKMLLVINDRRKIIAYRKKSWCLVVAYEEGRSGDGFDRSFPFSTASSEERST